MTITNDECAALNANQKDSWAQLISPELQQQIESACAQACQMIAPAWPLDRAIAVNPHWSRIGMPVRRVAARMAVLGDVQLFPSRATQRLAWEQQRIQHADLQQALSEVPAARAARA